MDRLAQIFEHQLGQTTRFHEIYQENGLLLDPNIPVEWTTRQGCTMLHLGIHWFNVEMTETLLAHPSQRPEELADALHFLTELSILAGFDYTIVPEDETSKEEGLDRLEILLRASQGNAAVFEDPDANIRFTLVASLAAADLLKNKPWKQSVRTDLDKNAFRSRVQGIWYWFGACVRTAGMTSDQIFEAYLGKEKTNYHRVATGV